MASQFKNRLVGVTILVALVVIFLPSIIDGKKVSYQQEFVSTPIKPELKEHSNAYPEPVELTEQTLVVENEPSEADTETETKVETPTPPQNNNQQVSEWKVEEVAPTVVVEEKKQPAEVTVATLSKPKPAVFSDPAWTIQVGAFKNKTNINALIKNLAKAGFKVYTTPREVMDGQLTRVFVGPDVSKDKLETQLTRLKNVTKLNGKIVPFSPISP